MGLGGKKGESRCEMDAFYNYAMLGEELFRSLPVFVKDILSKPPF